MPLTSPADVPAAFRAAWNAHDMDAFGAMFHADASFVNRFGAYIRGVADIVDRHREIHQTVYRDSQINSELIAVDEPADGVAIVHFWCRLSTGAAHPAGPHQVDTLLIVVVTRAAGAWLIQAVENVTLTDPRTGVAMLRP